jgi:hypothetical protein
VNAKAEGRFPRQEALEHEHRVGQHRQQYVHPYAGDILILPEIQ